MPESGYLQSRWTREWLETESETMKKMKIIILATLLLAVACARTPSPSTAHNKMISFFTKYGKKYKLSEFGQHRVQKVEIVDVTEIQKNMAEVDAYAYLADSIMYKVSSIFVKKPFGWKLVSWESLGKS